MHPLRLLIGGIFAATLLDCSSQKVPAQGRRPGAEPNHQVTQASPRAQLGRALRQLPRPGDFFAGVPPSMAADLASLVARLEPKERARLTEPSSEAARERPLLHLVAGGKSLGALWAVANGQGAVDLMLARQMAGHRDLREVVVGARAFSHNAALAWLEERWVDLGSPSAFTAELGDQVAMVTAALGRPDLALLAARAAADVHGDGAHWLRVAEAASRVLDLPLAEQALDRGQAGATDSALDDARVCVVAARTVLEAHGQTLGPEAAVKVARAHLRLGRVRDALGCLEPHRALFARHLSLTAAWAVARLDASLCRGLPPLTPPPLCAAAWQDNPETGPALAALTEAWKSRAGRDAPSIETYLGLVHVVPWIFSSFEGAGAGEDPMGARFTARLAALAAALGEAAQEVPSLQGPLLFVDTLRAGVDATATRSPGRRTALAPAVADRLWQRATELAAKDAGRASSQGAVLSVAAMLMQDRDPRELVERLPPRIAAQYVRPRALLRLWSAIAHRRLDQVEPARAELVARLPPEGAFDRSQTVLLLAEAEAALRGRSEDYAVLDRVSGQLLGEELPLGLRIEAAIDRAGSRARQNDLVSAAAVLGGVLDSSREAKVDVELRAIAQAYLGLLRTRTAPGPEKARRFAELESGGASLPPAASVWHELWRTELGRQLNVRHLPPRPSEAEQARRMGTEAARVLGAGTLPVGSVESNLSYSLERGLVPVVKIELRLLAAEMPPHG